MLTTKQKELLMFIHERLKETGVSPSFDEMKEALDLKSKSGIHRLITALEERGFLRRLPHRARALEIVRLPDSIRNASSPRPRLSPRDRGSLSPASSPRWPRARACPRPSACRSWAGSRPAFRSKPSRRSLDRIDVPPDLLTGDHFALEVNGDSMIDAGILDGDVIIRRATPPTTATLSWRWSMKRKRR